MSGSAVTHSQFVVERRFRQSAATVFAALAEADRKRRWFAEGELHEVEEFVSDFRVGGVERLRYRFLGDGPVHGVIIASEGRHEDIVRDRRVVVSSRMTAGDHCFSCSLVTLELLADGDGTRLVCTFQGAFFEGADGPEIRRLGWEALLDRLGETLA